MSIDDAGPIQLERVFEDRESLREELDANLRHGSVFVATQTFLDPGQPAQVLLHLPDGQDSVTVQGTILCRVPGGLAVRLEGHDQALRQLERAAAEPEPEPETEAPSEPGPDAEMESEPEPQVAGPEAASDSESASGQDASLLDDLLVAAGEEAADSSREEPPPSESAESEPEPEGAAPVASLAGSAETAEPRRRIPYRYQSIEDLQREYELDLRYGRLFVTTEHRPPVGAEVDVVLLVPGMEALTVPAEVVFHATGGIGGRILDFGEQAQIRIENFAYEVSEPAEEVKEALPDEGDFETESAPRELDPWDEVSTEVALKNAPPAPDPVETAEPERAEPERAEPERAEPERAEPESPPEPEGPEPPTAPEPAVWREEVHRANDGPRELRRKFTSRADMQREYETNVRSGGVFVPTQYPPPLRSQIRVKFELEGESRSVTIDGEVVFDSPAGVGVQLQELSAAQKVAFEQLVGVRTDIPTQKPKRQEPEESSPQQEEIDPWSQGTAEVAPALRRTGDPNVHWADEPQDLTASRPAGPTRTQPAEPVANLRYELENLEALRTCYADELSKGFVRLEVPEPPPEESPVRLTLVLPAGGEVVVRGGVAAIAGNELTVELVDLAEPTTRALEAAMLGVPVGRLVDSGAGTVEVAGIPPSGEREPPGQRLPKGEPFQAVLTAAEDEPLIDPDADLAGESASWLRVLVRLHGMQATGVVSVEGSSGRKELVVHQGRVVDACSRPPRDDETLPEILRRLKLVRGASLERAREAVARSDTRNEVAAIRQTGLVDPRKLEQARAWQVLEVCAEVISWSDGRVVFDPNGDISWAVGEVALPVEQVVLQGLRNHSRASRSELESALRPVLEQAPRSFDAGPFDASKLGLDGKDQQLWALMDGKHTVRELLMISPIGAMATLRVVFAAARLGLVRFHEAVGGQSDPVAELESQLERVVRSDLFGRLGLSWQASGAQLREALERAREDYGPEGHFRDGDQPQTAELCDRIFELISEAYRDLAEESARRRHRNEIVDDPERVKATARMHAEQGKFLLFKGDYRAALASYEIASELDPANPAIREGLQKARTAATNT